LVFSLNSALTSLEISSSSASLRHENSTMLKAGNVHSSESK